MDREHALMIVKCYKEAILPLLANAKVYLYGSCSRNEARKDSDIDVAVVIPSLMATGWTLHLHYGLPPLI